MNILEPPIYRKSHRGTHIRSLAALAQSDANQECLRCYRTDGCQNLLQLGLPNPRFASSVLSVPAILMCGEPRRKVRAEIIDPGLTVLEHCTYNKYGRVEPVPMKF